MSTFKFRNYKWSQGLGCQVGTLQIRACAALNRQARFFFKICTIVSAGLGLGMCHNYSNGARRCLENWQRSNSLERRV